ncbi:hypothetical protein GCM10010394_02100 [Streptomyces crystallinus]|uniref:Uncharacterized protein n=1 Tax=Streptomyces crystallinus TaxID=68191 RepID=A0ABP3PWH8_9ACTN
MSHDLSLQREPVVEQSLSVPVIAPQCPITNDGGHVVATVAVEVSGGNLLHGLPSFPEPRKWD